MLLLLGYGNPLRTDDGIGQAVVHKLAEDESLSGVELVACHQLLPEHAEPISQAQRVIFVDADAGPQPGKINVRELQPDAAASDGLIHDFTPQTLLAYAELLYGRAPHATLVTISGFSFAHGEALSKEMTAVLPEIITTIIAQIDQ
jgi:hydrogenase maturation protease